jgi:transposase-like protein
VPARRRDALTVYLRFPREHWTRLHHSNFIERVNGQVKVPICGQL